MPQKLAALSSRSKDELTRVCRKSPITTLRFWPLIDPMSAQGKALILPTLAADYADKNTDGAHEVVHSSIRENPAIRQAQAAQSQVERAHHTRRIFPGLYIPALQ